MTIAKLHGLFHHPKPVAHHYLLLNAWNEVACLIPFPYLWDGIPQTTTFPPAPAHGLGYLFCLEDVKLAEAGFCLFPSMLKSEFHGVRRTIEAYSDANWLKQCLISRKEEGSWHDHKYLLRVTDEQGSMTKYELVIFE